VKFFLYVIKIMSQALGIKQGGGGSKGGRTGRGDAGLGATGDTPISTVTTLKDITPWQDDFAANRLQPEALRPSVTLVSRPMAPFL